MGRSRKPRPAPPDQIDMPWPRAEHQIAADRKFCGSKRAKKTGPKYRATKARLDEYEQFRALWDQIQAMPSRFYEIISGEQPGTLVDQAERFDIPVDTEPVDLTQVIPKLHAALKYVRSDDEKYRYKVDHQTTSSVSPALEKQREVGAELKKLELKEKMGELVDRTIMVDSMRVLSDILRRFGERLERHHGRAAKALFDATLDMWSREVDKLFEIRRNGK